MLRCVCTGCEAKVGHFSKWSLTLLAQNRPIVQKQFCPSEVRQTAREVCNRLKSFASCPWNQILVALRRVVSCVNVSWSGFKNLVASKMQGRKWYYKTSLQLGCSCRIKAWPLSAGFRCVHANIWTCIRRNIFGQFCQLQLKRSFREKAITKESSFQRIHHFVRQANGTGEKSCLRP